MVKERDEKIIDSVTGSIWGEKPPPRIPTPEEIIKPLKKKKRKKENKQCLSPLRYEKY